MTEVNGFCIGLSVGAVFDVFVGAFVETSDVGRCVGTLVGESVAAEMPPQCM
jgi:hypothetical protein